MIDLIFYFSTEIVFIRIRGNSIMFANSISGSIWCPIDGLKISMEGACKEFPDLKGKDNWKEEAIRRFKEKIINLKSEEEVAKYLIEDLRRFGYTPKFKQRAGFRREIIK